MCPRGMWVNSAVDTRSLVGAAMYGPAFPNVVAVHEHVRGACEKDQFPDQQSNRIGPGLINSALGESDLCSSLRTNGPHSISKVGSF